MHGPEVLKYGIIAEQSVAQGTVRGGRRRQETGDRRVEAGGRRLETGDWRDEKSGERNQKLTANS